MVRHGLTSSQGSKVQDASLLGSILWSCGPHGEAVWG